MADKKLSEYTSITKTGVSATTKLVALNGSTPANTSILSSEYVEDSLTSNDSLRPLSAAQGKALKDTADALASTVAGKVNTSDVINNLGSSDTNKPLSAAQGKVLNDTITAVITSQTDLDHALSILVIRPRLLTM